MKKLLVFSDGRISEKQQLDDYLYDSEVTRDDFIDLDPSDDKAVVLDNMAVRATSWDVVFKGDDKFDQWHFLVDHDDSYDFNEPKHKAAVELLKPYHSPHVRVIAVIHLTGRYVVIYRVVRSLSSLFDEHLERMLESYNDQTYSYRIPESMLGPVLSSLPED